MNSSVILLFIDERHCLVASDTAEQIASEHRLPLHLTPRHPDPPKNESLLITSIINSAQGSLGMEIEDGKIRS